MKTWLSNPDNKLVTLNGIENLSYRKEAKVDDEESKTAVIITSYICPTTSVSIRTKSEVVVGYSYQEGKLVKNEEYYSGLFSKKTGVTPSLYGLSTSRDRLTGKFITVTDFNGAFYGPRKVYMDGKLTDKRYFEDGRGQTYKSYYDSGRLLYADYKTTKHGSRISRETEFYDNSANSVGCIIDTVFDENDRAVGYDVTTYLPDGSYAEIEVDKISFYTKDGRLVELLILGEVEDQNHHVIYDDNGSVVSDIIVDDDFIEEVRQDLQHIDQTPLYEWV